jgi:hypothetical protein
MGLLNHSLEHYARGIGLLTHAVGQLTPDQFARKPGPGNWSTAQVVLHLLDSDLVSSDRMKRVIAEDNPPLVAYDENRWADRLHYEPERVNSALILFDLNRRHMLEILRRLDEAAFQRCGMHSERGRVTLEQLVRIAAEHLDHHLKFIYEKRERMGQGIAPRYAGQ